MRDISLIHQLYLLNTYPFRGKTFVKGRGCYLYDENGRTYLDLTSNYGVNIFGHNYPEMTKALQEQLAGLTNLHCSFANDIRAKAAEVLVKRCGENISKVYFSNSGTEAVEAALKFAALATGKKEIISTAGAYHGKTFGALSVTHLQKYHQGIEDLLWKVKFILFGDSRALAGAISKDTAAFIAEPIQGEAGVIIPPARYLEEARNICRKNNVVLILDEVQTGAGRTGTFLAAQQSNAAADIICLGKGLAGGIPAGATLVSGDIARKIPKSFQTSTFGGNPLACRGIVETLRLLDEKMLERVGELEKFFINDLANLKSKRIKEVRGRGLMIGVEIDGNRDEILKKMQQKGILACPAGDQTVRFLPPYIITELEIGKTVSVLSEILSD
ncbi:MAG: aspartate aminotransferase family protein [Candidatus Magasanikbacteria bacterium]|nr:aspartate aminotransferase family protein [Candidatus Magasanikbacteria bacterium]